MSSRKKVDCPECGKGMFDSNLQQHISTIHKTIVYLCRHCYHCETKEKNILDHIEQSHPNIGAVRASIRKLDAAAKTELLKCELCIWKTNEPQRLRQHMRREHSTPKRSRQSFPSSAYFEAARTDMHHGNVPYMPNYAMGPMNTMPHNNHPYGYGPYPYQPNYPPVTPYDQNISHSASFSERYRDRAFFSPPEKVPRHEYAETESDGSVFVPKREVAPPSSHKRAIRSTVHANRKLIASTSRGKALYKYLNIPPPAPGGLQCIYTSSDENLDTIAEEVTKESSRKGKHGKHKPQDPMIGSTSGKEETVEQIHESKPVGVETEVSLGLDSVSLGIDKVETPFEDVTKTVRQQVEIPKFGQRLAEGNLEHAFSENGVDNNNNITYQERYAHVYAAIRARNEVNTCHALDYDGTVVPGENPEERRLHMARIYAGDLFDRTSGRDRLVGELQLTGVPRMGRSYLVIPFDPRDYRDDPPFTLSIHQKLQPFGEENRHTDQLGETAGTIQQPNADSQHESISDDENGCAGGTQEVLSVG